MPVLDPIRQRSAGELAIYAAINGEGYLAVLERLAGWDCPWATHCQWVQDSEAGRWWLWPFLRPCPAWIDADMMSVPAFKAYSDSIFKRSSSVNGG